MVLLTGTSGYVGRHLATELVRRGVAVRGLVHHRRHATPLVKLGVEVVEGDVLRPASLALACDGCDTVVHLVGLLREGWRTTFDRVVVAGSHNVIEACCDRRVPRFAYASALGRSPMAVPIPTAPLRLAARLLAPVAPLLPVTADQLRMMAVDGTTDDEGYRRFSSVVPRSIEEGVRRALRAGG